MNNTLAGLSYFQSSDNETIKCLLSSYYKNDFASLINEANIASNTAVLYNHLKRHDNNRYSNISHYKYRPVHALHVKGCTHRAMIIRDGAVDTHQKE